MSLQSADGENGFPGEVDVNVTYQLTDDNRLVIKYTARTRRKPTPISLSSRLLFNLAGKVSKHLILLSTGILCVSKIWRGIIVAEKQQKCQMTSFVCKRP